ncbi:MAG: glycosyltransferase family 39 protein [Candidatus Gastranaerophilales bacterium]|nr:glycosyltransferase family 39 protein [Candidatus Gastranaerophilales bacterium]
MDFVKKEYKSLIVIISVFILCVIWQMYKTANFYVDFGREAYYPQAILNGELLYRDIFNNYGPFSYLYNAFLYKLFGSNLCILYFSGCLNALSIVITLFIIARNFLSKRVSCVFSIFILIFCCFGISFMNYIMPYSYAMVYGLNFFLISVALYLKYIDNFSDKKYLFLAFLFAGLAVANKYEFGLYLLMLIGGLFWRKENLKNSIVCIGSALFPSLILFLFLFYQGLTFDNLLFWSQHIFAFATAEGVKNAYGEGLTLSIGGMLKIIFSVSLLIWLVSIITFIVRLMSAKSLKYALPAYVLTGYVFIILMINKWSFFLYLLLSGLCIIVTILMFVNIKKLLNYPKILFLSASALLISLKSYWLLNTFAGYGKFFVPLLLLAGLVLIRYSYIKNVEAEKVFNQVCVLFLIFYTIGVTLIYQATLAQKTYQIETPRGKLLVNKTDYNAFSGVISYLQQNAKASDKVYVLPEPALVNFLTDTKANCTYNALTPEFIEAFGEDKIIKDFEKLQPEYIIMQNSSLNRYSYIFGFDYGHKLYMWVFANYSLEGYVLSDTNMLFFKKK